MILIHKIQKLNKKALFALFMILGFYTAVHFLYSGVYFPLIHTETLLQIQQEVEPLLGFFEKGEFSFDNPRQYGPFFIFLITPFMIFYNNQFVFATALLIFAYFLTAGSFYICYKYIFQPKLQDAQERRVGFWAMVFLWLNFSPLLYMLAVRNVEIWELFLICLAFMMYIKRRYFWTGFSFAAGALIKMLPAVYIFYFLFKNRKVFVFSLLSIAGIVLLAHFIFGPGIGLLYLPFLLTRALGSRTWCVTYFENLSLKSFIYKLLGGFRADGGYYFSIGSEAEKTAFLIIAVLQILVLSYLIWTALKKSCSKEEIVVQFSLVSVIMLVLSPVAALEYGTLLLFAYSAGLYFVLYKDLPKYMYVIYGGSYFLAGNFLPLSFVSRIFFLRQINALLGNTKLDLAESYKAYCFPLIGFILLAVFFIILWHNKQMLTKEGERWQ